MRGGKGSKYMKMKGKCTGPKYLAKNSGRWCKRHMGGHAGRSFDLVQKMPGLCATENGTQIDEPPQAAEKVGTKDYGRMLKRILVLEKGRILNEKAGNWEIEGQKRRDYEKRVWKMVE